MLEYIKRHRYPIMFWAIFLAHLIISYYGVVHYRYAVAPGDDTIAHLDMVENLKTFPIYWPSVGYPPLFHYLILGLSVVSGITASHVLAAIWPIFIVSTGLGVFFLARQAFGNKVAIVAYVLFAFICSQPLQTAYDGGWPNIIASGVLIPLSLIFWIRLWQKFTWRDLGWFILLGLSIIYTHHLSTITWLLVVMLSGAIMVVSRAVWTTGRKRWAYPTVFIVILIGFLWAYYNTGVLGSAKRLLDYGLQGNVSPIWQIVTYSQALSGLVFQASFVGLLIAVYGIFKYRLNAKTAPMVVVGVYFCLYFFGSRLTFIAEPDRLARDLAFPACILASLALVTAFDYLKNYRYLRWLLAIMLALTIVIPFWHKTKSQLEYNPMIRFSKADQSALRYINDSNGPYPFLVWARNDFWRIEAKNEIAAGRVKLVSSDGLNEVLSGKSCGLAGYYKPGIWQEFLQDRSVLDEYLDNPEIKDTMLVEDPTKIWYVLCRK